MPAAIHCSHEKKRKKERILIFHEVEMQDSSRISAGSRIFLLHTQGQSISTIGLVFKMTSKATHTYVVFKNAIQTVGSEFFKLVE